MQSKTVYKMEHVSVHGVWSTQNAYACAKQMKSKRQTDKYYSLHLYIYIHVYNIGSTTAEMQMFMILNIKRVQKEHTDARFVHSVMLFPLRLE